MAYFNQSYIADADAWRKHFQAMANGSMDNGNKFFRLKEKHVKPHPTEHPIKVVSDTAQTVEAAKADVQYEKLEEKQAPPPNKPRRKLVAKRGRAIVLKDNPKDIFSR